MKYCISEVIIAKSICAYHAIVDDDYAIVKVVPADAGALQITHNLREDPGAQGALTLADTQFTNGKTWIPVFVNIHKYGPANEHWMVCLLSLKPCGNTFIAFTRTITLLRMVVSDGHAMEMGTAFITV